MKFSKLRFRRPQKLPPLTPPTFTPSNPLGDIFVQAVLAAIQSGRFTLNIPPVEQPSAPAPKDEGNGVVQLATELLKRQSPASNPVEQIGRGLEPMELPPELPPAVEPTEQPSFRERLAQGKRGRRR